MSSPIPAVNPIKTECIKAERVKTEFKLENIKREASEFRYPALRNPMNLPISSPSPTSVKSELGCLQNNHDLQVFAFQQQGIGSSRKLP